MVLPDLISDVEEASIQKENQNTENTQASSSAPSDVAQTNQSQSTTKKRGLSENVGEQEEPAHKKCFRK
ncbi:hypothetical protein Y032_0989g3302 [Ancylostoma ceylanicum]|uniref:Uncharacterized protein n=1 Tax=Ancylostoma ceylanicum TaxID=53326 RepID=A0A016W832_9BILA|nr:hypothetical protein Y032_0989g3302 [Ancylostoma ceylanicum]